MSLRPVDWRPLEEEGQGCVAMFAVSGLEIFVAEPAPTKVVERGFFEVECRRRQLAFVFEGGDEAVQQEVASGEAHRAQLGMNPGSRHRDRQESPSKPLLSLKEPDVLAV